MRAYHLGVGGLDVLVRQQLDRCLRLQSELSKTRTLAKLAAESDADCGSENGRSSGSTLGDTRRPSAAWAVVLRHATARDDQCYDSI